jgi:Rad3-related DNA helicase
MILDFNPLGKPYRDVQVDILKWLEDNWDNYNVFVLSAPCGLGKSMIAMTLAKWEASKGRSTAILTPQITLQNQYTNTYKSIPSLFGASHYMCDTHTGFTCAEVEEVYQKKCKHCKYRETKQACIESDISVYNYHSYYALREPKNTLIIDEMQQLFPMLQELSSIKIWKFKNDYQDAKTIPQLITFLAEMKEDAVLELTSVTDKKQKLNLLQKRDRLDRVIDDLQTMPENYSLVIQMEKYKNRMEECLSLKPMSMKGAYSKLWKGKTDKVVLMSATVSPIEIELVGVNNMKVGYYYAPSPIPTERRPVYVEPVVPMYNQMNEADKFKMVEYIYSLLDKHPKEKGVIHATYTLIDYLVKQFRLEGKTDSRFLFFNKDNKAEVLKAFTESDKPLVLLASGISEGVSFDGDLCRWQCILKIQYQNLGDEHIKNMLRFNDKVYKWNAIKTVIQQSGRNSRGADDYGISYIADEAFIKLYSENKAMFPEWFRKSLTFVRRRYEV